MDYKKINAALAAEFGAGQVEVRKRKKGDPWSYTLWFLADDPAPSVVKKAKRIVGRFEPTKWLDDLAFKS
jgi:hypothetical protein